MDNPQLAKSSTCLGNHTGREINRVDFVNVFSGLRTEHKLPEMTAIWHTMGCRNKLENSIGFCCDKSGHPISQTN